MKAEKLNKNNIKKYISDMDFPYSPNMEKNIDESNGFGIKKGEKFVSGYYLYDNYLYVGFEKDVDEALIKEVIDFLKANLSLKPLVVQVTKAKNMEIMGKLYKTKEAIVSKIFKEALGATGPIEKNVKFKNLNIKYNDFGTDIFCDLAIQGIKDEEVIKFLDDYFVSLGLNAINLNVSGDCLEFVKTRGYISDIAKYIID